MVFSGMQGDIGGYTSALRIATYLNKYYDVVYTSCKYQSAKSFHDHAKKNLPSYEGRYIPWDVFVKTKDIDVLIATSWPTAFYMNKLKGYKMYFIQDYEPFFYEPGDFHYLAKQTYHLGYHMVSLGGWNAEQIKRECGAEGIQWVDFPYEPKEYKSIKRNYMKYKARKKFRLCVYSKMTPKRMPVLTEILLSVLKKMLKEKNGIELDILYFGFPAGCRIRSGKNLGILNKEQLFKLYCSCDFGMVSSVTNISLVPYEMLATGLPVIEFQYGTFPYFFPEGSAVLTDFTADNLYARFISLLKDPKKIQVMMDTARQYISTLDWDRTCEQFLDIIRGIES